jgi:hypothetical protein
VGVELPDGFELVGGVPAGPVLSHPLKFRVESCRPGPQANLLTLTVRTAPAGPARILKVRASYCGLESVRETAEARGRPTAPTARQR